MWYTRILSPSRCRSRANLENRVADAVEWLLSPRVTPRHTARDEEVITSRSDESRGESKRGESEGKSEGWREDNTESHIHAKRDVVSREIVPREVVLCDDGSSLPSAEEIHPSLCSFDSDGVHTLACAYNLFSVYFQEKDLDITWRHDT